MKYAAKCRKVVIDSSKERQRESIIHEDLKTQRQGDYSYMPCPK